MKLWTFQPVAVYELLKRDGVFRCDKNLCEGLLEMEFTDAYNWMVEQMKQRVGLPPAGIEYPVWAWHTLNWRHKKPDLRIYRHWYESSVILLELEMDDSLVLLSDEDNWYFVLNNHYYGDCFDDESYDRENEWLDSLDSAEQTRVKTESWEKIFDLSPIDTDWSCNGRDIQATFWELKLSQVVRAYPFKGGRKPL